MDGDGGSKAVMVGLFVGLLIVLVLAISIMVGAI